MPHCTGQVILWAQHSLSVEAGGTSQRMSGQALLLVPHTLPQYPQLYHRDEGGHISCLCPAWDVDTRTAPQSHTHHISAQECYDFLLFFSPTKCSAEQTLHKILLITHLNWLNPTNIMQFFHVLILFSPQSTSKRAVFTADDNTFKPRTMHAENTWIFFTGLGPFPCLPLDLSPQMTV